MNIYRHFADMKRTKRFKPNRCWPATSRREYTNAAARQQGENLAQSTKWQIIAPLARFNWTGSGSHRSGYEWRGNALRWRPCQL